MKEFYQPYHSGLLQGFKSLIDKKLFLAGDRKSEDEVYTLQESEQRCSDHVAAILEEQNDPALTLTQRQERWRYR